jgi:hypothetical protein
VEDTWQVRDLPVLRSVVELLDHSYMVTVSDIAVRTGLDLAEVARSLEAMDPTFLDFRKTETGGDPTFWYVNRVTPEARRAVGQWPTAEGLIDRLVRAFNDAADGEEDAERYYHLRQVAGLLGDAVRDVAIRVAETVISPSGVPGATGVFGSAGATAPAGASGDASAVAPSSGAGSEAGSNARDEAGTRDEAGARDAASPREGDG